MCNKTLQVQEEKNYSAGGFVYVVLQHSSRVGRTY